MSQQKRQIKIGLTGGIGVGKTFVSEVFLRLGFPVFNADFYAKKCIAEIKELRNKICEKFGDEIFHNGKIDKQKLADIVFSNSKKLKELNDLVHPFVYIAFEKWLEKQESEYVIKETAILFEEGIEEDLDLVICVSSKIKVRIQRVMDRDKCTKESVMKRIRMQMPQEKKEKLSDFVIFNNENQLILPQIIKIIKKIS